MSSLVCTGHLYFISSNPFTTLWGVYFMDLPVAQLVKNLYLTDVKTDLETQ